MCKCESNCAKDDSTCLFCLFFNLRIFPGSAECSSNVFMIYINQYVSYFYKKKYIIELTGVKIYVCFPGNGGR